MFGNSSGVPNWHQATATSPSKTSAAWARPSSTSRSLSARLSSALKVFSACIVWNQVHQHPPHTPLCRSARSAKAPQVSGPSDLIVYSSTAGLKPSSEFQLAVVGGPEASMDMIVDHADVLHERVHARRADEAIPLRAAIAEQT